MLSQSVPSPEDSLCLKCGSIFDKLQLRIVTTEWWHDIPRLQKSAAIGCPVCKLVKRALDTKLCHEEVQDMQRWQARFTIQLPSDDSGLCILCPTQDPRPESTSPPTYSCLVIRVDYQLDTGMGHEN